MTKGERIELYNILIKYYKDVKKNIDPDAKDTIIKLLNNLFICDNSRERYLAYKAFICFAIALHDNIEEENNDKQN